MSVSENLARRRVMRPHCAHPVRIPWPEAHAPKAPPAGVATRLPGSASLGVASLALGLLAVMALCLPVVGHVSFVLSGIGLGLGLCGLACSLRERAEGRDRPTGRRRDSGGHAVNFPLAGAAVYLLALALASLPFLLR